MSIMTVPKLSWSLTRPQSPSPTTSGPLWPMRSGSKWRCSSKISSWLTMARRTSECCATNADFWVHMENIFCCVNFSFSDFNFFPLSPQCECGIFDPVWNQGHHPGYGDLCSIPAETADCWDREADQGAVSTNGHTDSHCKQTWRWDYHLHHQQLWDADLLFQNWMESQVWKDWMSHLSF